MMNIERQARAILADHIEAENAPDPQWARRLRAGEQLPPYHPLRSDLALVERAIRATLRHVAKPGPGGRP